MKKTLLLSVVASTLIMAGGDIEPVAAPVETSNWEWGGTAKVYYQTMDHENYGIKGLSGNAIVGPSNDMFDRYGSAADAGLQLRVSNKDVIGGFGFGAEITALNTLNLVDYGVVTASMQSAGGDGDALARIGTGTNFSHAADSALSSAWVSQAYITYGLGNTSFKVGRQELPKSLSPFAFSEGWNVFKNTFEAALIVNTDITDTTLVGAYVNRSNGSLSWAGSIVAITAVPGIATGETPNYLATGDLANWQNVGENGTYMLTAQNKSIDGLTATGTFYYAPSFLKNSGLNNGADVDAMVLWGDAAYNNADFPVTIGLQGGIISADTDASVIHEDTTSAYGAKIGGHFGDFSALVAYTGVVIDDVHALTATNFGTGVKSPLYTQMVLNQIFIDGHQGDNTTIMVKGVYKGLGGKFIAAYGMTDVSDNAGSNDHDYNELDLIYATKFNTAYGDLGLKAMWMNQDFDWGSNTPNRDDSGETGKFIPDTNNVIRLIASYDF